ncbi:MAG: phosphoribosylanthranilate isomerase [Acidimicrobiales bacterium]
MFVKVCGTTTEEDALLAVAMGADAVGFIFAPSPRQISPTVAGDIAKRLPSEILTVGVFRDEAPQRVVDIVNRHGLRGAQLHGKETAADTRYVAERVGFCIKAFPAGDATIARATDFGANAVLLDAPFPGSGHVFDWRLAEGVGSRTRLILAGGLDSSNVAEAIAQVHPWGVDAASGLEASPGHKDPLKLQAFVEAAKGAEPDDYRGSDDMPYDWQEDF